MLMRKKVNRTQSFRPGKRKEKFLLGNYIIPTKHAIKRYQERIRMVHSEKAQNAIIEGVKRSRLIALTSYSGREIRENRGIVFVCELQGNYLYVITVLISQVDLRFVV
jgi:hypothetical protein